MYTNTHTNTHTHQTHTHAHIPHHSLELLRLLLCQTPAHNHPIGKDEDVALVRVDEFPHIWIILVVLPPRPWCLVLCVESAVRNVLCVDCCVLFCAVSCVASLVLCVESVVRCVLCFVLCSVLCRERRVHSTIYPPSALSAHARPVRT